jgi:hypothetical protein
MWWMKSVVAGSNSFYPDPIALNPDSTLFLSFLLKRIISPSNVPEGTIKHIPLLQPKGDHIWLSFVERDRMFDYLSITVSL